MFADKKLEAETKIIKAVADKPWQAVGIFVGAIVLAFFFGAWMF